MKVGKLRHRLQLQKLVDAEDSSGEIVRDYENVVEVWGSIEPVSGREFVAAQQINSEITTRIVIRWRKGVEATNRILHSQDYDSPPVVDVYDVVAPLADPVVNRRWITLLCVKRASEGFRSGQ